MPELPELPVKPSTAPDYPSPPEAGEADLSLPDTEETIEDTPEIGTPPDSEEPSATDYPLIDESLDDELSGPLDPPETYGPPTPFSLIEEDEDFDSEYMQHNQEMNELELEEEFERVYGPDDDLDEEVAEEEADGLTLLDEPEAAGPPESAMARKAKGKPGAPRTPHPAIKSFATDVLLGSMQLPRSIARGAFLASKNTLELTKEVLTESIPSALKSVGIPVESIDWDALAKASPGRGLPSLDVLIGAVEKATPKPHRTPTVTAGFGEGIAQFMVGFLGAGKVIKGVGLGAKMGASGTALAAGFVSDFSSYEKQDDMLGDLLKKVPVLGEYVPEFMRSSPNDTDMQKRFKRGIEGLGLGVLGEAFVKAVTSMNHRKGLNALEDYSKRFQGQEVPLRGVSPDDFKTLGEWDKELIFTRAEDKLGDALKGASGAAEKPEYINFLRIESEKDIKTVMQQMADADAKAIDKARGGRKGWEEAKLTAEQENAFQILAKRTEGEPLSQAQTVAARRMWVTSANKLKELSELARDVPTPANLFMFRKMQAIHYMVQREVMGARAETARALNAWAIPLGSSTEMEQQILRVLEAEGGFALSQNMANTIANFSAAGMAEGVENMVKGSLFAKFEDAFAQLFVNSLLTSPQTHVVNAMSNTSVAVMQIYERKTAEFLSRVLGAENGVVAGEAMAMLHGMMEGTKDGFEILLRKFKMAESVPGATEKALSSGRAYPKMDRASRGGSVSSEALGIRKDTVPGRTADVIDAVTQVPGKLLGASDDIFKAMGYRMELRAQAVRKATHELRGQAASPEAFKKRVAEIIENPPNEIKMDSVNQALYQTFQNKATGFPKQLMDVVGRVPILGRITVPFREIPANIANYGFERTPIAPLIGQWNAEIAAGGARRDVALARMATGTSIVAVATDLALQGEHLTGRLPSNPGERQLWQRIGKQPYSIKLPGTDTWVSYARFEPFGYLLGFAADVASGMLNAHDEADQEHIEKAIAALVLALPENFMSKTYMSGFADLVSAIHDPDVKGAGYITRLLGNIAAPPGVAAMARVGLPFAPEGGDPNAGFIESLIKGDPNRKAAWGILEQFMSRTPGLNSAVPEYRDLWGRTVDMRSGLGRGYDMFMPIYLRTENPEPIDSELSRLKFYPQEPAKQQSFHPQGGKGYEWDAGSHGTIMELDAKQMQRLKQIAGSEYKHPVFGKPLLEALNEMVQGKGPLGGYYMAQKDDGAGPESGKAKMIEKWRHVYYDAAKQQLLKEDGDLRAKVLMKIMDTPDRYQEGKTRRDTYRGR